MPLRSENDSDTFAAFHSALLSCTIRLQGKGTRTWLVEVCLNFYFKIKMYLF